MSLVHIYAPPAETIALVLHCPTCDRLRRMVCKCYEWHDATKTCAGCGDSWTGGYRDERPFAPGWRRRNREYARRELVKIGVPA